jgi:hypothetical protein
MNGYTVVLLAASSDMITTRKLLLYNRVIPGIRSRLEPSTFKLKQNLSPWSQSSS